MLVVISLNHVKLIFRKKKKKILNFRDTVLPLFAWRWNWKISRQKINIFGRVDFASHEWSFRLVWESRSSSHLLIELETKNRWNVIEGVSLLSLVVHEPSRTLEIKRLAFLFTGTDNYRVVIVFPRLLERRGQNRLVANAISMTVVGDIISTYLSAISVVRCHYCPKYQLKERIIVIEIELNISKWISTDF